MRWEFIDIGGLSSSTCNDAHLSASGYFPGGTLPDDFTRHAIYQSEWNAVFNPGSYMTGDSTLGLKYTGSQIEFWKNGSIAADGLAIVETRWNWYDTQQHNNIIFVAAVDRDREVGTFIVYKRYFGLEDGAWNAPPYDYTYFENWQVTAFIENHDIYLMLLNLAPVHYNWKPIPSVGGKMGLFEFSEIKEAFIGDGSQVTDAPESNILRFMESTNLKTMGDNLFVAIPTEVCYSGDNNAMKFTRTYVPLIGDHYSIYFYMGDTLVYTYMSISGYDAAYLSFVVDEENEVAAISVLYVNNNPVQVTYNEGGLNPSHDLYLWFVGNYNTDPEENEPEDPEGANPWIDESVPGLDAPTISAVDTGFTSMYVVTKSELQSLAQYMWSDSFLTNLKKLFSDPRQIIVGLTMFPLTPDVGDSKEIKAGGISTGVFGLPLSSQYKLLDEFGTIYIQKEKGCFLDYPPFTKVVAHLPYVGEHELDVNDIMGKTIALKYLFDFLTGACVAEIDVNGKPRYFFSGQTGVQIPTSSEDFTRQFTSFLSAGVAIGTALAAPSIGAAAAPMMIGAEVNAINNGMSPTVSYSSGGGGVNGFLSSQGAYITIELPENKLAAKQPKFVGKPSYIYAEQLEDCKGYIKCYSVHLDSINCLPSERREIEQRLLAGCRIEEGSSTPSYTPTETGDYGLIFMKMSSDLDVIGKSWDSTTLTIEGKLFYEKDITKPVFLISGNVSAYNYCYIPHFNRFYHIEEIVDKTGSMQEIHMSVDPLQSFKSDILDCDAILERAEDSDFINSKFNDSMMWTQQNKKIITVNFKANGTLSKFPRNSNVYVLTIAGGD